MVCNILSRWPCLFFGGGVGEMGRFFLTKPFEDESKGRARGTAVVWRVLGDGILIYFIFSTTPTASTWQTQQQGGCFLVTQLSCVGKASLGVITWRMLIKWSCYAATNDNTRVNARQLIILLRVEGRAHFLSLRLDTEWVVEWCFVEGTIWQDTRWQCERTWDVLFCQRVPASC